MDPDRTPSSAFHGRHAAPDRTDGEGRAVVGLEETLAFLVRGLEAVQRLRRYPLERAHYLLIRLIEREGALTVGTAARRLLLDDSTVTRQVAVMVKNGLIGKRAHPDDARASVLTVTASGREAAEAMRSERLERLERLFSDWSEEDRQQAVRVLARLNQSLAEVVDGPSS